MANILPLQYERTKVFEIHIRDIQARSPLSIFFPRKISKSTRIRRRQDALMGFLNLIDFPDLIFRDLDFLFTMKEYNF